MARFEPCPHCGAQTLPREELSHLSTYNFWICPNCDGLVGNPMARALLPKLLGAVVCSLLFLVVVKFFRSAGIVLIPVSALVGFVVAYVGSVRWAKPYAIVGTPKYCEVCNRDDVGYAEPSDSVCADCKERVEYDRIMAEQRRLESKPGYVRPAAVEREIARLSKWDRRHGRPNEEL